ncbi:MAG: tetratricopeptide repeat protein [Elainellaceae cyanobacterium]
MLSPNLDRLNQREFRKLLLSIKASSQQLDLLLAICDDRNLQAQLIEDYEAELEEAGVATFRVRLNREEPSLRAALEELVAREPALQRGAGMVTVLNASELLGVRLKQEQSEQERFFFSLQWTREALRQFEFPVVLWLADSIATRLSRQAPDFWSWRSGVFEFVAQPVTVEGGGVLQPMQTLEREEQEGQLSVGELQRQIAELEQSAPESPLLITLYNSLGEAYQGKYKYFQALEQYEKALALAEAKQDKAGQARALRNLGDSLRYCGRPFQSIDYYQQALALYRELVDCHGEATTLYSLGISYWYLGEYKQAIDFYQRSLKVIRKIGDRHEEAFVLHNLGLSYWALRQYQQAIDFYQQSLNIAQEIENRYVEAYALNGLGNVYWSLKQYQQAIDFYQQSLEIMREVGDLHPEVYALGGLGNVYRNLGKYQQSIDLFQQSLEIARKLGNRHGESYALGGLGHVYRGLEQYQRAIDFYQQRLDIAREISDCQGKASSLSNLGNVYNSLEQYQQAIDFHQQHLDIAQEIGDRRGEAHACFNKGVALANLGKLAEARVSFAVAREVYSSLGLLGDVEDCDSKIQQLNSKELNRSD